MMKKPVLIIFALIIIFSCNKKEKTPQEKATVPKTETLENKSDEPDEDPAYVFRKPERKRKISSPNLIFSKYNIKQMAI
jgi:hypothetical protein